MYAAGGGMFAYFVSVLRNFARFLQGARLKYVITRRDPACAWPVASGYQGGIHTR